MNVTEHREKVLIALTEIQGDIKYLKESAEKSEHHLEKINGRILDHDRSITRIKTWGTVALILLPIIVNALVRLI